MVRMLCGAWKDQLVWSLLLGDQPRYQESGVVLMSCILISAQTPVIS